MDGKRNTGDLPEKDKTLLASHILVSYRNAEDVPSTVLRSKEEAQVVAGEILNKLKGGANFAATVKDYSDDPKTNKTDGKISSPIKADDEGYGETFNTEALKLTKKRRAFRNC